jgi:hypothetical protein
MAVMLLSPHCHYLPPLFRRLLGVSSLVRITSCLTLPD